MTHFISRDAVERLAAMPAFMQRTACDGITCQVNVHLVAGDLWRDEPAEDDNGPHAESRRAVMQAAFRQHREFGLRQFGERVPECWRLDCPNTIQPIAAVTELHDIVARRKQPIGNGLVLACPQSLFTATDLCHGTFGSMTMKSLLPVSAIRCSSGEK